MNDAGIFVFTPLALAYAKLTGLEPVYCVVLTTIAVNIGSSLTPIGNPQNIIIWHKWSRNFIDFTLTMTPFTLTSLAILITYSRLILKTSRRQSQDSQKPRIPPTIALNNRLLYMSSILLILNIVLAHHNLVWLGLLATILAYLVIQPNIILGIDYILLIVFVLLFIDFKSLAIILPYKQALTSKPVIIATSTLLSQVISNVPTTILLLEHVKHIPPLLIGVNIGGVGTPISSLANIIALRLYAITAKEFTKISIPYLLILLTTYLLTSITVNYP